MFSSYLLYQTIDLLVAILWMAWVHQIVRRPRSIACIAALTRRTGPLLRSPVRRLWAIEAPLFAVGGVVFVLGLHTIGARAFDLVVPPGPVHGGELGFLGIGVVWYGGGLLYPLLGAALAWRRVEGRRRSNADLCLATSLLLLAPSFLFRAMAIEPQELVVETVQVALDDWPAGRPPLRVVLLADVQSPLLGERERRIPDLVAALHPDLVLVPGDLMAQSLDPDLPRQCARYLARNLRARLGVYAVNGDVDGLVPGGLAEALRGTGVRLLDNESVVLDGFLELLGCDPSDARPYRALLREPARAALRLGLVHRPRHVFELDRAGADLVVAGHTHGGQVRLPGFGAPITLSPLPREIAEGGLHRVDGTQLYVSRGIGTEVGFAPTMRFRCPPEISLLILGPSEAASRRVEIAETDSENTSRTTTVASRDEACPDPPTSTVSNATPTAPRSAPRTSPTVHGTPRTRASGSP